MSQIIVAQNIHGIVLAADNQAIRLNEKGEEISLKMDRLIPIATHCGLLVTGAAEGTDMGKTLGKFIQEEGMTDVQDIYGASLAFLSTEYERFMRKKCELLPIDPLHQVSFILAGRTERDKEMPFRLYFLWTKKKLPRLDGDEISYTFSLPRRMGLEFQLNKMGKENAPLHEVLKKVTEGMGQLKARGGASSFLSYATITLDGFQSINP
ncbi:MAG: hypothetical protein FJ110_12955 [Deltaproteobacteria bacterium]|nr:hypothetical protein [Deltaproteobacteria bacterium]